MWIFEVSTVSSKLQRRSSVAYFDKSFTALSIGPCGRLPQIIEALFWFGLLFSALLQACSKPLTLHPTRDSPLSLYSTNLEAIGFCDEIWTAGPQPVLCAARRRALCVCWRAVLLEDESGGQLAIALKKR